jgi:hypothetical protein
MFVRFLACFLRWTPQSQVRWQGGGLDRRYTTYTVKSVRRATVHGVHSCTYTVVYSMSCVRGPVSSEDRILIL